MVVLFWYGTYESTLEWNSKKFVGSCGAMMPMLLLAFLVSRARRFSLVPTPLCLDYGLGFQTLEGETQDPRGVLEACHVLDGGENFSGLVSANWAPKLLNVCVSVVGTLFLAFFKGNRSSCLDLVNVLSLTSWHLRRSCMAKCGRLGIAATQPSQMNVTLVLDVKRTLVL